MKLQNEEVMLRNTYLAKTLINELNRPAGSQAVHGETSQKNSIDQKINFL